MKIISIEITSFGKFKNKTFSFDDGINILSGHNESGKSTIISFIYAMLYGFGDNRGKGISMREKYTPWEGGECEGKLNVFSEGNYITIYRKAGSVKKYDILKVYNTETAEVLKITPEELVKINSDTFLKTLCIRQLASSIGGGSSEIVTRLANIAKSGDEGACYEKAIKIIENARREIRPMRGSGGTLVSVSSEISALERAKEEENQTHAALSDALSQLSFIESTTKKAENDYENALKENYDADIANVKGRLFEKEVFIEKNKKSPPSKKCYIAAASAFMLLSLVMLILKINFWFSPLLAAAAVLLPLFLKKNSSQYLLEVQEAEKLRALLLKLENEKSLHAKKTAALKADAISARRSLEDLNIKISSLKSRMTFTDTSILPKLYKERDMLEKNLSLLTLVQESLESSHSEMQRNFTPLLNKKASGYFQAITEGKYARIFCDEEFNLRIEADIPRESDFFSGGTVDQLYLSLRLALIDMLFDSESTFILLDQPFLQYDKERTLKAMELFKSLSLNRQIILFTTDTQDFLEYKSTQILT